MTRSTLRAAARLACVLALAACDHGAPFQPPAETNVGPAGTTLPLRLTWYPLNDRSPSVSGTRLLFTRQSDAETSIYTGFGREECIAIMPVDGGTISASYCPDRLIPHPDSLVDTWFEPSLSPDGRQIAFMWQRAYRVSALGFLDAYLMVTPLDRMADTTLRRLEVSYVQPGLPNPIRADIATRITWPDDHTLRFLATYEHIQKVKGGGAERVTDTTDDALALMELDLPSGASRLVPGGDSVLAYAAAPSGGIYVVREADSTALLLLDPATGTTAPVAAFPRAVRDIIVVDGLVAAVAADSSQILTMDPATGQVQPISGFAGPVRRLAAAGGRRFVAEIENAVQLFGAPTDLWLMQIP